MWGKIELNTPTSRGNFALSANDCTMNFPLNSLLPASDTRAETIGADARPLTAYASAALEARGTWAARLEREDDRQNSDHTELE
ncbi:hypothetical protein NE236_10165 [Actinoallomurus purpureus]|uniref:hypothetical protein n=1 Tax=Actinoallomurus purpureus TaxID=478114 RepID=UPI0020924C38|nr:hypothetical protein [Actinoallomurus purpureus]MCO6005349.1 hypothetical protein [Actinoallomurus purpureus]